MWDIRYSGQCCSRCPCRKTCPASHGQSRTTRHVEEHHILRLVRFALALGLLGPSAIEHAYLYEKVDVPKPCRASSRELRLILRRRLT